MPHLGEYERLLQSVFFLYESEGDAFCGNHQGGTGFLVALPADCGSISSKHHFYGVTNYHLAHEGYPVIRLNKEDGTPDILPLTKDDWHYDPMGCDLAVTPLSLYTGHKVAPLTPDWFVTKEDLENKRTGVGLGEDVFMAGRFVDYDGTEDNQPSLRFGHLSIMHAPIEQKTPWKPRNPSHVIDLHSRSGYSGSPVFVYHTPGSILPQSDTTQAAHTKSILVLGGDSAWVKLLGIHWGQFPEQWQIEKGDARAEGALVREGEYVNGLSGMTLVIPAAEILKLLKTPKLEEMREKIEIQWLKEYKKTGIL